jgi:hypothetical protein
MIHITIDTMTLMTVSLNGLCNAWLYLLLSEPIIKPVKNKQFTLMEQELPQTVYDME